MSNNYFRFKQFIINQDRCAMKVGTDGVLLGAWSNGGNRILDIGTGTGLVALMMAQRFSGSIVDAVEINTAASEQASENVSSSPYNKRVNIFHSSLQDYAADKINHCNVYDSIVCNPPFFEENTLCPDASRNIARHTESLTYKDLLNYSSNLLSNDGSLSIIVPSQSENTIRLEASFLSLFVNKICYVRTTPNKPPKRILMSLSKSREKETSVEEQCLMKPDGNKSEWYSALTKDFYL